jgi:hypothetical protein
VITQTVATTTVTMNNVPNGTYFVRIRTKEAALTSAPSNDVEVQVGQTPGAPGSLAATVAGTTVSFTWLAPATGGAPTTYLLEAGTTPGASNIVPIRVTGTSYTALTVPAGSYYVRVRAANDDGTGPASNEVIVTVEPLRVPGAPSGLTASRVGNEVTVTWNAPTTGGAVSTYQLEAGSSSTLSNLAVVTVSGTTFRAAAAAGTYYVRVRAVNAAGVGAASNEVMVAIP